MKLRWLGHSAFELQSDNGLNIIVDPFIQANPACPLKVSDVHPDVVCITHGHADHFGDVIEIAKNNPNLVVIANYEISIHLQKEGINAIGINCGASIKIEDIEIRMLDAKHSSSLDFKIDLPYAGNPGSFLFTFDNNLKVFHAGDTGLFSDMKFVIGEVYKPDIALLPIGNIFTMDPHEASIAAEWINPKFVIPMHYNSFPSIAQDGEQFKKLVKNSETLLPKVMETLEF
ncbi:MAG: metal-dependent hydrolase [Methanobrevibacter sp.]|uniref:metal-dependent hydrolase n=1 Tax=Methanobrevibacter sp. TaxID=66852 RepID=UPI0025DDAAB7|nr:metal-dependent hydrolase [Methanobrevibacter sp.]MBQ8017697.1 metal-dependent hydrolase [Methanobrevibacter sp.]